MKQKKLTKKCLSILLSIVIFVTATMPLAFATDTDARQPDIASYINDVLPKYLAIEYRSDYSNIQISQGLIVNGNPDDNSRTFFVTNNREYIGCLVVTTIDDAFYSSFRFDDNEDVIAVIESSEPMALFAIDDRLFMQTSNSNFELSEVELSEDEMLDSMQPFNSTNFETSYTLTEIVLNGVEFDSADIIPHETVASRAASSNPVSLDVQYVANASSPQGAGLCWAACIAAVLKCRTGMSFNATSLYNALASLYPVSTPNGTEPWYTRGYSLGGLTVTYVSSGLNFSSVYTQLSAGKPLILWITTATGSPSHDIVCKYLYSDPGVTMYGFMDPNSSSTVYISRTGQSQNINDSTFVYAPSTTTYTKWHHTIY